MMVVLSSESAGARSLSSRLTVAVRRESESLGTGELVEVELLQPGSRLSAILATKLLHEGNHV